MKKFIALRKKMVKTAVVGLITVGIVSAVYAGLTMMLDSVSEQKAAAEGKFNTDNGLLASLRDQMDKSGEAEKRYALIQEKRKTDAYETDIKTLENFLANAEKNYNFVELKIKRVAATVSDKPELVNFNYNVQVWNRFKITFKAVSDVHLFSFLDEFRHALPGFIRIDAIEIKRVSDFTETSFMSIKNSGTMPLNVEAKVEFTWIGLSLKDKNKALSSPSTPTP